MLHCIKHSSKQFNNHCGAFIFEPLETGQGITLGNSLRRTLLTDLCGYGIRDIRINNLQHEFGAVRGLREDVFELLLNLKGVILKGCIRKTPQPKQLKGYLHAKGPLVLTAGMLRLPAEVIAVANSNWYLGTLLDSSEFYLELDIFYGHGYLMAKTGLGTEPFQESGANLHLENNFSPIRSVNYYVKLIHDTRGNIKESLTITLETNESITPYRALTEAVKILLGTFHNLYSHKLLPGLVTPI